MLYYEPNEKYGTSYEATVVNCIDWVAAADRTKLCAQTNSIG
jgi:hypothetical protein